jgi:hypothetical protein
MLMDKSTEIIAHMIGVFNTTLEDARMRDAYDKFKALQASDPENNPVDAITVTFKASHTLESFTPSLRYSDMSPTSSSHDVLRTFVPSALYPAGTLPPLMLDVSEQAKYLAESTGFGRSLPTLEPAGSVIVITEQFAHLSDNDLMFLGSGETIFTDPAKYLAQLEQYLNITSAIGAPTDASMIIPGEGALQSAIDLRDGLAAAQTPALSGVFATILRDADASGVHIDGQVVEEAASLEDLWPAFKSDSAEDAQGATSQEGDADTALTTGTHEFPDPFEGLSPGSADDGFVDIEDGHAVVAGANTLINEVIITSAWLDAPVFSVMGSAINLDVISQINVLVDHDQGTTAEFMSSTAMNVATLTATASAVMSEDEDGDGDEPDTPAEPADLGLPSHWVVTKISGDLLCVNQVSQFSFVTDFDRAEIEFSSANTYIGLGDNTVMNLTDLAELGYGYDLIMIGGNMISINWISQVNVMIDNDTLTYSGTVPGAFSGGDNLLFNGAIINSTGIDSYGQMQDNFATASTSLADGGLTIDESVAHDSVFEGVDILRVLYIDGDFTTINWIEQTNVLGDSDQVHLALDNLEAATGASVTVTTGSNATVNIASITEYGVDSMIAVNGDVYDDALLYQAGLVDTDADPLGVDMPALASEAVAFLADDMMSPDTGHATDAPITITASESTASSDVMQSMLA